MTAIGILCYLIAVIICYVEDRYIVDHPNVWIWVGGLLGFAGLALTCAGVFMWLWRVMP